MRGFWNDLRYSWRQLGRTPGLTAVAVLSLGLGIGANTTVFTWLERFVLRPLPAVERYDRLVAVRTRAPENQEWSISYPSFRDWRAQSRSLDLAVTRFFQGGLKGDQGTQRVWAQAVSGNYFEVVGVSPLRGRALQLEDETKAAPVAVLGYSFWRDHFAADSGVVGRSLVINGHPLTVVGVAPPDFGGTIVGLAFDLYIPLTIEPGLLERASWLEDRGWQSYEGVGRLREGASLPQARSELDAIARRVAQANGAADVLGALVNPFGNYGGSAVLRPALLALLGVTAIVLLIACSNVANILLARAVARRREIGIRLSLGASRSRLIRQLLTESLTLAVLAGLVGVGIAAWGRDLMYSFVPPPRSRLRSAWT